MKYKDLEDVPIERDADGRMSHGTKKKMSKVLYKNTKAISLRKQELADITL
jgi:hypothetical protein